MAITARGNFNGMGCVGSERIAAEVLSGLEQKDLHLVR